MNLIDPSASAQDFAASIEAIERALDVKRRATNDHDSATSRVAALRDQLLKAVGPNMPRKVFDVGEGRVVIVQHGGGVTLETTIAARGEGVVCRS
jgi:hypothetical protein